MAINRSVNQQPVSVAEAQLARVAGDGCARHPHLNGLLEASGRTAARDLADAVHLLCSLHGRYPGPDRTGASALRQRRGARLGLTRAAEAFERERLYLVRLTSAVGPLPSTPGAAETEASLVAARHALETLATSERNGCALGAATRWLATGGRSVGCSIAPPRASGSNARRLRFPTKLRLSRSSIVPRTRRPASARSAFGGEQLLLQHRALFDLLEARAAARGDY